MGGRKTCAQNNRYTRKVHLSVLTGLGLFQMTSNFISEFYFGIFLGGILLADFFLPNILCTILSFALFFADGREHYLFLNFQIL